MKKFKTNEYFRLAAKEFIISSTKDEIIKAGGKAKVALYGGKSKKLDDLRYLKYVKKVSTSKTPKFATNFISNEILQHASFFIK